MLTRQMNKEHQTLLDKFRALQEDKQLFRNVESEGSSEQLEKIAKKLDLDIRKKLKREKKLNSTYRSHSYGERKRVIELRFGRLGSLEPAPGAPSFRAIAKALRMARAPSWTGTSARTGCFRSTGRAATPAAGS